MADRTGNPEIDALIEEFLRMPQGDWTTDDNPYEALRDPENSHGNCQVVTEHFVEFARSKGFKAYVTHTDLDEMGYEPTGEGGEIGFNENDEMEYGFYPEHTIATIVVDDPSRPYGREYYIDFTATQYGYTDHPKVTTSVKTADAGLDFSQDNWTGPQSTMKLHVTVPGAAPGMGDPAILPGSENTLLKNPCWCDVDDTPHEWNPGTCEDGKKPVMQHEAADYAPGMPQADAAEWDHIQPPYDDGYGGKLPTPEQLQGYVDTQECHDIAPWVARDFGLGQASGAYIGSDGRYRDHAWAVASDGTIIDTTHGQFDPKVPIMYAKPGTSEHSRYVRDIDMSEEQRHRTYGDDSGFKPGERGYLGPYTASQTVHYNPGSTVNESVWGTRHTRTTASPTPSQDGQDEQASQFRRSTIDSEEASPSSKQSPNLEGSIDSRTTNANSRLVQDVTSRSPSQTTTAPRMELPASIARSADEAKSLPTIESADDESWSTIPMERSDARSVDSTTTSASTSTTSMEAGIKNASFPTEDVDPRTTMSSLGSSEKTSQKAIESSVVTATGWNTDFDPGWTPTPIPDTTDYWVWLDGKVGWGGQHHEIVRNLANELGYDPTNVNYISNLISRNGIPEGHAIATGTMNGSYPQIYFSTRDRNAIWDDVARSNQEGRQAHRQTEKMQHSNDQVYNDGTYSGWFGTREDAQHMLEDLKSDVSQAFTPWRGIKPRCPDCGADLVNGDCQRCGWHPISAEEPEPYDTPYTPEWNGGKNSPMAPIE